MASAPAPWIARSFDRVPCQRTLKAELHPTTSQVGGILQGTVELPYDVFKSVTIGGAERQRMEPRVTMVQCETGFPSSACVLGHRNATDETTNKDRPKTVLVQLVPRTDMMGMEWILRRKSRDRCSVPCCRLAMPPPVHGNPRKCASNFAALNF